mmetsp:Transcript_13712/g.35200  ORF Transcript_13712/g.35200 Transcript_13712/m.35200 type:complete len:116 (+) Transcript_13712:58-405(+)
MVVDHIKVFIPSKDYEISKSFYGQIGFKGEFVSDELTLFENGDCQFFLQNFYQEDLASNFMLQICVLDIEAAYLSCEKATDKLKISDISTEAWGKVFYLWGPSGELLHITELQKP